MMRREFMLALGLMPMAAIGARFFDEARVYDVVVLNLDGIPDADGDIFDGLTTIVWKESLPVYLEVKDGSQFLTMASMSLIRPGGRRRHLRAYMNFNAVSADVKAILPSMTPSVEGSVARRDGAIIRHAEITKIRLSTSKNSDSRIKALGSK
jgi:hypothetical protein